MKKLIRFSIVAMLLLVLLAGGSMYMLKRYLNSPRFPADLSAMASKELRGELEVTDFNLEGRQISSESVRLTESGKIKEVQIEGLETSLGKWAVLKRKWTMENLKCDRLHLHIGRKNKLKIQKPTPPKKPEISKPGTPSAQEEAKEAQEAKEAKEAPLVEPRARKEEKKKEPIYEKLIPTEVEFKALSVGQFSGLVERKRNDHIRWENIQMNGKFKGETLNMVMTGGTLWVPLKVLPEWELIKAQVIATTDTYEVKDADFILPKGGSATVNGGGDISGGDVSAIVDLQSIPVSSLFKNPTKHAELSGLLNGNVKVVSEDDETVVKGSIIMNEGVLRVPKLATPVLRFLEINEGHEIRLDQCTADVTNVGDRTIFENLNLSVGTTYQITGRAQLHDNTYMVQCNLGISYELYRRLPDSLAAKYEQKGQYYWISVNAAGDKDDIASDLAKKAASELGSSILGDSDVLDKIGSALGEEAEEFLKSEDGENLKKKGLKALEKLFR